VVAAATSERELQKVTAATSGRELRVVTATTSAGELQVAAAVESARKLQVVAAAASARKMMGSTMELQVEETVQMGAAGMEELHLSEAACSVNATCRSSCSKATCRRQL
jgi:hypothetical protein